MQSQGGGGIRSYKKAFVAVCTNVYIFVCPLASGLGGGVQGCGFWSRGKVVVQGVRSPGVESPGGRFGGVEGDQMRGRSS